MSEHAIKTYDAMLAAIARNAAILKEKRESVIAENGSVEAYTSRLFYQSVVSDNDHDAIADGAPRVPMGIERRLAGFYPVYEECFPIAEERRSQGSFLDILTKRNFDQGLKQVHGEFREFVYAIRDPDNGAVIGGLNFSVYLPPADAAGNRQPIEGKYAATVHSNYVFLGPKYRGLNLARTIMNKRDQIAAAYVHSVDPDLYNRSAATLTISEQNAPELMDPLLYLNDSAQAVDQLDRLKIWTKLGYNRIDLTGQIYDKYVQPPYAPGAPACEIMRLNCYATALTTVAGKPVAGAIERVKALSASTLRRHLFNYFGTCAIGHANAMNPESADHCPTSTAAMRRLDRMGDTLIQTFTYEESDAYIKSWQGRIHDFLKSATLKEIMSGRPIKALVDAREAKATLKNQGVLPHNPK